MKKLIAVLFLLGFYNLTYCANSTSSYNDPCNANVDDISGSDISIMQLCTKGYCTGQGCDLTSLNISQIKTLTLKTTVNLKTFFKIININANASQSTPGGKYDTITFSNNFLPGTENSMDGVTTTYNSAGDITIGYGQNSYLIPAAATGILNDSNLTLSSSINNSDGSVTNVSPVMFGHLAVIEIVIPATNAASSSSFIDVIPETLAISNDSIGNITLTYNGSSYTLPASDIIVGSPLTVFSNQKLPGPVELSSTKNPDGSVISLYNMGDYIVTINVSTAIPCVPITNLSGAQMDSAYLPGINLDGANLTNTSMNNSCLANGSFKGILGPDQSEALPQGLSLIYSNISGSDFTGANLNGAAIGMGKAIQTIFNGAILTNLVESLTANDSSGDVISTDLSISSSIVENAVFDNANMVGMTITNSNNAFIAGNFSGSSFKNADLQNGGVSFITFAPPQKGINGTDFTGTNFTNVVFNNVDISNIISLSNANFSNALFNGVIFCKDNSDGTTGNLSVSNPALSSNAESINFSGTQFNQTEGTVALLEAINNCPSPQNTSFNGALFTTLNFNSSNIIDISSLHFDGATFGTGPDESSGQTPPAGSTPLMFGTPGKNVTVELPLFTKVNFYNVIFQGLNSQLNATMCSMNNFTVIGNSQCPYANTDFIANNNKANYGSTGPYWANNGSFSIGSFVGNSCTNCNISNSMILNQIPEGGVVSGMEDTAMAGDTWLVCNGFNLTSLVNTNIKTNNKDFITRNYILAYCHTTGCDNSDPEIAASRAFHNTYDHYNTYRYYNPYTGKNGD